MSGYIMIKTDVINNSSIQLGAAVKQRSMRLFSINYFLVLCLILLLLSVESSLQTSIIWDRSTAWTLWLYKVGPFSVADIIIIAITGIVIIRLLLNSSIPASPYLLLCLLALAYLCIGFIYNVGVYTLWKTYLYDVKVFLYLLVPYLFLNSIKYSTKLIGLLSPKHIFTYMAIASLIDSTVVNLSGTSEYPQILGFPAVPPLLPMAVILAGIIYAKKATHKIIFLAFLGFEFVSAVNRLSLGLLFNAAQILLFIFVLHFNLRFTARFIAIFASILLINLASLLLVTNPFNWTLLAAKAEGSITRQVQMENAVENFKHNIPGAIGKGLGSTWFEYIPIP